ncbi:hypothetical protein F5884DRAFT_756879 [Xylogone sp. PMI_703]|nr:hypothetical protein F5884DRAFT_756879 [Xylogone sp. PMI_703]
MKFQILSAAAFIGFLQMVNADAILSINNPPGTNFGMVHLIDLGVHFVTSQDPNPAWTKATNASVVNAGRLDQGVIEVNNCTAYKSSSCTGSPSVTFLTETVEFPEGLAGQVGCFLCL